MARKPSKTGTDKKPASKKATRKKPAARKPRAATSQGTDANKGSATPPEVVDTIWRLYDEGLSKREIARRVGVSEITVRRKLQEDPERRVAIERSAAEERGKLYEQIENKSTKLVVVVLESLDKILHTAAGKPRIKLSDDHLDYLDRAPRLLSALGGVSDKATKNAGGLNGVSRGPDGEVKAPATGEDKGKWTGDDLVITAIKFDVIHRLPASLQETAKKLIEEGAAQRDTGESDE